MDNHRVAEPCAERGQATVRVVLASRQGTAHEVDGTPRQDRLLARATPGVLVVALADGVGTQPRSAEGAQIAVDVSCARILSHFEVGADSIAESDGSTPSSPDLLVEMDGSTQPSTGVAYNWNGILFDSVVAARRKIEDTAKNAGVSTRSFSTTLCVAVLHDSFLHVAQVGDGYAVVWSSDAAATHRIVACDTNNDDRDPSSVVPITVPGWIEHYTFDRVPFPPHSLALLATDGVAPFLLDRWIPPIASDRFLRTMESRLSAGALNSEALGAFLDSDLVNGRTDDDKTMALLHYPDPERSSVSGRRDPPQVGHHDDESSIVDKEPEPRPWWAAFLRWKSRR